MSQDHHGSGDGEQRLWHGHRSGVGGLQRHAADLLPHHAAEAQPGQPRAPCQHCPCPGDTITQPSSLRCNSASVQNIQHATHLLDLCWPLSRHGRCCCWELNRPLPRPCLGPQAPSECTSAGLSEQVTVTHHNACSGPASRHGRCCCWGPSWTATSAAAGCSTTTGTCLR